MNKLRVFDAFSGIGGFRFGLKNSKLFHDSSSFVGYTDSDRLCRKVYSEIFNCPEENVLIKFKIFILLRILQMNTSRI